MDRFGRILILAGMLALLVPSCTPREPAVASAGEYDPGVSENPSSDGAGDGEGADGARVATPLYVQEARTAYVSHEGGRVLLTLMPVERTVSVEDEDPVTAEVAGPDDLAARWESLGFSADAPPAVLVLTGPDSAPMRFQITVRDPGWDAGTRAVVYDVDPGSGSLPAGAYTDAMLFIRP